MFVISVYDILREKYLNFPSTCSVGRKDADILFPFDEKLSRLHCQFFIKNDIFYIKNLGSTNHCFVGQEEYAHYNIAKVRQGDIIEIGRQKFKFLSINKGLSNFKTFPIAPFEEEFLASGEINRELTLVFKQEKPARVRCQSHLQNSFNMALAESVQMRKRQENKLKVREKLLRKSKEQKMESTPCWYSRLLCIIIIGTLCLKFY